MRNLTEPEFDGCWLTEGDMKHWHAVTLGFGALYVALLVRSALKNYAGVNL